MVRGQYAPVYRHRSVEFGDAEADGDKISQVLTVIDNDNKVWKALYELARQPDGTWLISGCVLIRVARDLDLRPPAPRIFLDMLRCIIHEHGHRSPERPMRAGCVKGRCPPAERLFERRPTARTRRASPLIKSLPRRWNVSARFAAV